jgi:hypothetical protein
MARDHEREADFGCVSLEERERERDEEEEQPPSYSKPFAPLLSALWRSIRASFS